MLPAIKSNLHEFQKSKCNSEANVGSGVQIKFDKVNQFYLNKLKVGSIHKSANLSINQVKRKSVRPLKAISSQNSEITAVEFSRPKLTLVFNLLAFKQTPNSFILDLFYSVNFPICGDSSKFSVSHPNLQLFRDCTCKR